NPTTYREQCDRARRQHSSLENRQIDHSLNPVNLACGFGKAPGEALKAEITDGYYKGGILKKICKVASLIGFRAENVVSMARKAIGKSIEVFQPPGASRSQPCKMDVYMRYR